MPGLKLRLAYSDNPRTRALVDGTVQTDRIGVVGVRMRPSEIFTRAFTSDDFDACEMSLSSFLVAAERTNPKWLAIPVFPSRRFFHTWVLCNEESSVNAPSDLRGKRVGLSEYQMAAGVWLRGALEHEFGVTPGDVIWVQERPDNLVPMPPPKGVAIEHLPKDRSLEGSIMSGRIDAVLYREGMVRKRDGSAPLHEVRGIHWLFPDTKAEELRYFKKTGVFPMNHVIVIRQKILHENPWMAAELVEGFEKSKEFSYASLEDYDWSNASNIVWQRFAVTEQREVFGNDPYPYGMKSNRKALQVFLELCMEQQLLDGKVGIDDVFDQSVLDL